MASNIQVFLRVRPSAKPSPNFFADAAKGYVTFETERHGADGEINNNKNTHTFRFNGILGMHVSQQDVFEAIAKPVIGDVLSGLNGTIFAYGQTGSGKTFTITGGPSSYEDRGLIPRTLAYMFDAFRTSTTQFKMYISYLEIYQDKGYDLLRDGAAKLEDLPKVVMREDGDGHFHLRNLSINVAGSQEEALNLLFLGDTNRVVAETPMNDASTRSHCLFIIWVESMAPGSDVVRRSKLHLVDLAGSERVSQTGVVGKLLKEATAINQSLHFLERVIVALHARAKGENMHVPYRDSMMTSVLRDSLGGNCKTTMVACIAAEVSNLPESLSTCRFAQRVAQVQNAARVNEELDPQLLIGRLKREVVELKQELAIARGGGGEDSESLTEDDMEQCRALVMQYVSRHGADIEQPFVCGSISRMRTCFRIVRDLCLEARQGGGTAADAGLDPERRALLEAEEQKLRLEIAQRDQEIAMMVQMLSKPRPDGQPFIMATASPAPAASLGLNGLPAGAGGGGSRLLDGSTSRSAGPCRVTAPQSTASVVSGTAGAASALDTTMVSVASAPALANEGEVGAKAKAASGRRLPGERPLAAPLPPSADSAALLLDQQKALEVFKATVYKPPTSFEENKGLLRGKFGRAKALGEEANSVRVGINQAKTRLERLRTERAMTAAGRDDAPIDDGPEELAEIQEIDKLKVVFRDKTSELRSVKAEVEMIQKMLDQQHVRMQKEFEVWFAGLRKQAQLSALDEETKRELYEKVTGVQPPTPSASGVVVSGSGRVPAVAEFAAAPRTLPASSAFRAPGKTGDSRTDNHLAAYYASIGESPPRR